MTKIALVEAGEPVQYAEIHLLGHGCGSHTMFGFKLPPISYAPYKSIPQFKKKKESKKKKILKPILCYAFRANLLL